MLIKKFSQEYFSIWNEFVKNSKQGTFLLNRDYMDYHSDRFIDYSLMFYNEKDNLIALLPANIKDSVLYSHQGLSYGGLIYGKEAKTIDILNCFKSLKDYAPQLNIKQLIYKRIPSVYYSYPADEDLYALFRNDAKLTRRDISYVIDIQNQLKWNELRKRCLKKAIKENLIVKISQDYRVYHELLSHILNISHDTKPVHSAEEMELLSLRFPDNIKLICCYRNNQIVSGILLFIEKNTIHTQYIATSNEGKDFGAFEAVVNFLLNEFGDKKYLSFGISTENNGAHLNEGLAQQKESFGARGVCHDFYQFNF